MPVAYAAGWLLIRATTGPIAAAVLLFAGAGLGLVVVVVMAVTGYSVAHHAERERRAVAAIEADRRRRALAANYRKELTP